MWYNFGTTNTSAACFNKLISLEGEHITIPSAIFFSGEGLGSVFGRQAIAHYKNGENGRLMRSLKRVLGTELMRTGTLINNRPILFKDIIASFLKNIKEKVEAQNKNSIENVVLGRPVHFRDNDPVGDKKAQEELEQIAKTVGFRNISFQYEPIAGAFAHEQNIEDEKLAFVIDIGGGTSDFSVIRLGKEHKQKSDRKNDILANSGIRVGGNDFDKALAIKSFMPELGMNSTFGDKNLKVASSIYFELAEWSKINSAYSHSNLAYVRKTLIHSHCKEKFQRLQDLLINEQGHNLLEEVEMSKIALGNLAEITATLSSLSEKPEIKIYKKDFEEALVPDSVKLSISIKECLKLAQIKPEQVELIILTGGSTEIPYLQKTLCQKFTNAAISSENKLSSVALGLGLYAKNAF
ncbi:MAG: Hsp70 family protein [Alphaproteobacteria bacterium]